MTPFFRLLRLAAFPAAALSLCHSQTAPVASASPTALAAPPASAAFSASVPSGGKHDVVMPISKWGRYSIRASGERPVALSIADRRNGVIQRDGVAGQSNPRIDLFLDIGEYKLASQGTKKATGTSILSATPFSYPPDFKPSYLMPLRENRLALDDFQQAVFWFEAATDTVVYVEAVGRNLAELVLWRDGEWLIQTQNRTFIAKPKEETPLSGISFAARVPKGAYMVGAYGGKGRSWSIKSAEHPFFIQGGMETLAANVLTAQTIPPRGYAQMLLASGVNEIVVEGPDKKRLTAEINRLTPEFAQAGWLATDSIFGKSASPRILLRPAGVGEGQDRRVLKISGTPGQTFTVQTFGPSRAVLEGSVSRNWHVSSLHTGNHKDQFGASGVVIDQTNQSIIALQADTLSADKGIARRFNLMDAMNAFVWVNGNGKFAVTPGGTAYSWRLSRFFLTFPPNYKEPDWHTGSKTLELTQGLYKLELNPSAKGVATIALNKSSLLGGAIAAGKALVGSGDRLWNVPRPYIRFSNIALGPKDYYQVILNSQNPELAALSSRPSPIDPDAPLSLWSKAGETLEIPIKLAGRRIVSVTDTRGASVPFEIGGKRMDKGGEVESGAHSITIRGSGPEARCLVLKAARPELAPAGKPPLFPDEKRNALPKFAEVVTGKTVFLDLDRDANRPYAVRVSEPGLYRIETTGRLATHLGINDRFQHFTRTAGVNGVGRNALLIEYLLPGEYQVTVAAMDRSAGRLGLAVYRNNLQEGGGLENGIDNRKFVEAFSGAEYAFNIPASAKYRIESIGQNGDFPIRLEDKGGWPVEPAINNGPIEHTLAKGAYRLISLPAPQEGRRITRLLAVPEKRSIKGKGPHPLALNTKTASTWVENSKKDGAIGAPAVFTFSLPAPISAKLAVTNGFKAVLYKEGSDSAVTSWSGNKKTDLAMGRYRIHVAPERKKNHAPYQVSVSTRDLIPGLSYRLDGKETLALSVGTASIVELGSQGMLDVTATLLDGDGKTVLASNDDGFLDWNFSISRALKPGRYFLRTESAEKEFSSTTVFMRALTDTLMDTLSAGKDGSRTVKADLGRRLGVFPLSAADTAGIIACAAQGRTRIGLAIEKAEPAKAGDPSAQWNPIAQAGGLSPSVAIPRVPGARYRIKVWSEGNVDEKLTLSYASATARYASWKDAASGLTGQAEPLGGGYRAWYKVDLGGHAPGHLWARSDQNPCTGIGASGSLDSAFTVEAPDWFASPARYAWVELHFDQAGKYRVKLEAMALKHGEPLTVNFMGRGPRMFETIQDKGSVALLSAVTDGSHPLAAMVSRADSKDAGPAGLKVGGLPVESSLWMGQGRSAAISLPSDERRAIVWNALPPIDGTQPPVRLTWTELALSDGGALQPGVSSWSAGKSSARVLHVANGASVRMRVTLPPYSAAFVKRRDGGGMLECSFENDPVTREFVAEGEDLYLLALKDGARFDVATFALGPVDKNGMLAEQTLSPGSAWQVKLAREGETLLPLSTGKGMAGKPFKVYYRGAVKGADWIGRDGIMRADLDNGSTVGPGGIIRIHHTEGWAKLDLCDGKSPAEIMACKWGAGLSPSGVAEIAQSAQVKLRDRVNWHSFSLKDTQHVNLTAPLPLAAILLRAGAPMNYQEAWESFNWDLPLPPGEYLLGIHPLAGASLEGAPLSVLFRPIAPLSEKQPFTAFMVPGESRLLRFEVTKKADYGIGLSMDKETVQARLYDSKGGLVEQGKQQFMALNPGAYHLWLRVSEGAEGTRVSANLFGQEPPPNDPPERLVKWILTGAAGSRPEVENEQAAEPDNQRPAWERFLNDGYRSNSNRSEGGAGEGEGEGEAESHGDGEGQGEESGEGPGEGGEGNEGEESGTSEEGASGNGESEGE